MVNEGTPCCLKWWKIWEFECSVIDWRHSKLNDCEWSLQNGRLSQRVREKTIKCYPLDMTGLLHALNTRSSCIRPVQEQSNQKFQYTKRRNSQDPSPSQGATNSWCVHGQNLLDSSSDSFKWHDIEREYFGGMPQGELEAESRTMNTIKRHYTHLWKFSKNKQFF